MKTLLLIASMAMASTALAQAPFHPSHYYDDQGHYYYTSGQYLYDGTTGQEIGYFSGDYLYSSATGECLGYVRNGYLYPQ